MIPKDMGISMKQWLKHILFLGFVLILFSCAGIRRPAFRIESPIVRVGLLENRESVQIEPQGPFYILTREKSKLDLIELPGTWKIGIHESHAAEYKYRILLYETSDLLKARAKADEYKTAALSVELITRGEELYAGKKSILDRRYYRLYLTRFFNSREKAIAYTDQIALQYVRIAEDMVNPGSGTIKVVSPAGEERLIKDAMRFTGPLIKVKNIDVGTGFHWQRMEDRIYRGEIEVDIDQEGKLTVVNVLPLEEYLQGVVPAEMSASFPVEALKAQAITARTFLLYHFYRKHRNAPFDVCDDVHCQAYTGVLNESDKTNRAIEETRGLVLTHQNELCSTPYSAVCGGHTEDASVVWDTDGAPYLTGIFDIKPAIKDRLAFDLQEQQNAKKWISSQPNVFCHLQAYENVDFASYARKYFRWEHRIERQELERLIKNRTGEDVGTLLEIRPLERGVSGRISEILFRGTLNSVTVHGELRIRRILSETTLYSSCFFVKTLSDTTGVPETFILKGAGWGHGVGMCQIGASVMAKEGYSGREILEHYYRGSIIEALY